MEKTKLEKMKDLSNLKKIDMVLRCRACRHKAIYEVKNCEGPETVKCLECKRDIEIFKLLRAIIKRPV